jgi:hypothetical protein
MKTAWKRTGTAAYNAGTDVMTWGPALAATALYGTDGDTRITAFYMDHDWANPDLIELFRDLNGLTTYVTAVLIPDDRWETKAKRLAVEWSAFAVARQTVDFLNYNFPKETPDGRDDYAIGSHHALSPFAGAAMTRRNVAQMEIAPWKGYTIVGMNYFFASASAISRVQGGGHSFADQLVSVTLGNFIGLFFHDAFMLEPEVSVEVALSRERNYIGMNYRF